MYKTFVYEGELDVKTIEAAALSLWRDDYAPTGVGVLEGTLPGVETVTVVKPMIRLFGIPILSRACVLRVSIRDAMMLKQGQFIVSFHPTRGPLKYLE
ncbi:MAG: hypothetical protein UZ21_OP11001000728 [Microgenomates bacterium OLB22]|nr:MAG: hypothetical protein UZ21_OP11001000728 [Microgenomates bacterium OLB22]